MSMKTEIGKSQNTLFIKSKSNSRYLDYKIFKLKYEYD